MKKKKIFAVPALAVALCLAWLLPPGSVALAAADESAAPEWAVCVYMCGSDLESNNFCATRSLAEMLSAAPHMPQGMRVFVLTGGSAKWTDREIIPDLLEFYQIEGVNPEMIIQPSADRIQLFEITHGQKMIDRTDKLDAWVAANGMPGFADNNMGNADTARQYFAFITETFKPKRLMLDFWNHGSAIYGVAFDEQHNKDSLNMAELQEVMQDISARYGKKIDLVSFDACLMSNLEIAHTVSAYADYMLASEEITYGWNYLWLRNLTYDIGADTNSTIVPQANNIGHAVINAYAAWCANDLNAPHDQAAEYWAENLLGNNMALLDLRRLDDLYADFENLAAAMLAYDTEAEAYHFAEFSRLAGASSASRENEPNCVDLHDFAYNLTQSFADESSSLYNHLNSNDYGCQNKCQALFEAAQAVCADFGEKGLAAFGTGGVAEYNDKVVIIRAMGNTSTTGGLSFTFPQIGLAKAQKRAQDAINIYAGLDILPDYRKFLNALVNGDNNARRFMGYMQPDRIAGEGGKEYDMVKIMPEAAWQAVASVHAQLEYTSLQNGKTYVLGETDVDNGDWQKKEFSHYFPEKWYAINNQICSAAVQSMNIGEQSVLYFFIPGYLDSEPVLLEVIRPENAASTCAVLGYSKVDTRGADYVGGRLKLTEDSYEFKPVLAGDLHDWTTWEALYPVYLEKSENFVLPLSMDKLAGGEMHRYDGYFVLTDLTGAKIKSEAIPYAVANSLDELTLIPIPPQLYNGQPITPAVRLLFMGQEVLENGRDYIVEYDNNVEPGNANVLITAIHDGELDNNDTLELQFVIAKEENYYLEYVNWLIDNLPAAHLPGEEFAADFMEGLDYPYDEYIVHSLLAEEAKQAYELLSAEERGRIAPEKLAKLNEHHAAAIRNIINRAEGASEIFGGLGLMYFYNDELPAADRHGAFMLEFGLPDDADQKIKDNLAAALAAARQTDSRLTTAKVYNPCFEQDTTIYEAAYTIVMLMQSVGGEQYTEEEFHQELQNWLNMLLDLNKDEPDNGIDAKITQTLSMTGAPWEDWDGAVLKLELPEGYAMNGMTIYRVDPEGQEQVPEVNFITENGQRYAIFWTNILDSEAYYVLFAQPVSGSSGGSHRPNNNGGTTTKPTTPEKPGTTTTPGSKTITAANINSVFADVQNDAWYSEAIAYVYNQGIMNGTEKGFEPDATTTRAMLVTMLYRLAGEPATGAVKFGDVAAGQWFSDAIAWAAANGVVNGYSETRFAPNAAITREQLAAILYRFAQFKGYDVSVKGDLSSFSDSAAVSGWAQEAMQWAVGSGIINGDNNALKPAGDATRAEVAMMLMRFIEK